MRCRIIGKGNLGERLQTLLQQNTWVENAFSLESNVFFIIVKPKDVKDVCNEIAHDLQDTDIVVSCAAGINLETMENITPHVQITRCMPNICVSSGNGAMIWHGNVSQSTETMLENSLYGPKHVWVENERLIDNATLLFASQPAFQAHLAKSYIKRAIQAGFSEKDARELYAETMIGTGNLLLEEDIDEIIKQVCSKGGVTDRALKTLRDAQIENAQSRSISDGMMHLNSMIEKFN